MFFRATVSIYSYHCDSSTFLVTVADAMLAIRGPFDLVARHIKCLTAVALDQILECSARRHCDTT